MNRAQRREFEKNQSKSPKNTRVPILNEIGYVFKSMNREIVFDKDRLVNDKRLYKLYGLPDDVVMREIVSDEIDIFEEALKQDEIEVPSDIVKLDMFMTCFDKYVKNGYFTEKYEMLWAGLGKMVDTDLNKGDDSTTE